MTMENKQIDQADKNQTETKKQPRRPDEVGTIQVQAHLRIFDPETDKTIVETRG